MALSILQSIGIDTKANNPGDSPDNYYGSLGEVTPGKQFRVIVDRNGASLKLTLFDVGQGQEIANWVFPNCHQL